MWIELHPGQNTMLWRERTSTIQSRFLLVASVTLLGVCLCILVLGSLYHSKHYQQEVRQLITQQALASMATHTQERKQQNYSTLQRSMPNSPLVENTVFYDKSCRILTTTFLPDYSASSCPNPSAELIRIKYNDVLSPIGFIYIKLNNPQLNFAQVISWFSIVVALLVFSGTLINVFWKKFVYTPLKREIEHISSGKSSSLSELSPLGEQIKDMLQKARDNEKQKERLRASEEKFQSALRVAHDILAPISIIKNDSEGTVLSVSSQRALRQIQGIAFDLLPEKSEFELSVLHMEEIILDSIEHALASVENRVSPMVSIPSDLHAQGSAPHLIRALTNLIKNALEVQPAGIPIHIALNSTPSHVVIEIQDNGPGFTNYQKGTSSKPQGSGLGIASAQDAITRMKGTLQFETRSRGTVVRIKLNHAPITIYTAESEEIYAFGYDSPPVGKFSVLPDLSLMVPPAVIISPFSPHGQLQPCVRWFTLNENELERLNVVRIKSALLVEDDKYITHHWRVMADQAGICLETTTQLPTQLRSDQIVFLDRYLGDTDSNSWARSMRQQGHTIHSISATNPHAKTPPWLISSP